MKILVIRFSSIGDIVLTSPVVRALKLQLGAEVHYLSKQSFRAVLSHNPYIDHLHTLGEGQSLKGVLSSLRKEHFDAIIDLHGNLRSARVKWALRSVANYTFDKLNWQKWLFTRWKINRMPATHIVDRYLAAAAPLGIANDGQGLDYFIAAEEEVKLSNIQPSLQAGAYTALVIGAAHATKRLPERRLVELCQILQGPIVLLGGPDEADMGARIAAAAGGQVFNTCGQLKLNQSASVVRQAARVITHDTGLMHIAAAFSKPMVSIWGNTVPALGMYAYYPRGIALDKRLEVSGLSCRPCSKIGYAACPKGHFKCMQEISFAPLEGH